MSRVDAPLYTETLAVAEVLQKRIARWSGPQWRLHGAALAAAATRLPVVVAIALRLPGERLAAQAEADRLLVTLNVRLALARAAALLPPGEAQALAARLQTAGRMLGGWRKRQRKKTPDGSGQGAGTASPVVGRGAAPPAVRAPRSGTGGAPASRSTSWASAWSAPPPELGARSRSLTSYASRSPRQASGRPVPSPAMAGRSRQVPGQNSTTPADAASDRLTSTVASPRHAARARSVTRRNVLGSGSNEPRRTRYPRASR